MEVDVFHLEWSMFDERSRAHQTTTRIITTSFSFFWTTRRFFSSFFFCVYYQRELVSCLSILLLFLFLPLLLWSWRRLVVITSRTLQRPIKKKKHFWTPTVSDIMLIIKTENKNKAFRRDFYNTNGEREKKNRRTNQWRDYQMKGKATEFCYKERFRKIFTSILWCNIEQEGWSMTSALQREEKRLDLQWIYNEKNQPTNNTTIQLPIEDFLSLCLIDDRSYCSKKI